MRCCQDPSKLGGPEVQREYRTLPPGARTTLEEKQLWEEAIAEEKAEVLLVMYSWSRWCRWTLIWQHWRGLICLQPWRLSVRTSGECALTMMQRPRRSRLTEHLWASV